MTHLNGLQPPKPHRLRFIPNCPSFAARLPGPAVKGAFLAGLHESGCVAVRLIEEGEEGEE
jgi:hypothetical protein